jgi:hypothetical protein
MQEVFLVTFTLGGFVAVYWVARWGLELVNKVLERRVPREIRQNRRKA